MSQDGEGWLDGRHQEEAVEMPHINVPACVCLCALGYLPHHHYLSCLALADDSVYAGEGRAK